MSGNRGLMGVPEQLRVDGIMTDGSMYARGNLVKGRVGSGPTGFVVPVCEPTNTTECPVGGRTVRINIGAEGYGNR